MSGILIRVAPNAAPHPRAICGPYFMGALRLQPPPRQSSLDAVAPADGQGEGDPAPTAEIPVGVGGPIAGGDRGSSAEDVDLMDSVRQGDRGAFQALYNLFVVELLALCERILHNRADAEDVVAEVFWELWRRRERYDAQRGGPRPYLMTLARSRAIDRLRSQASRPETKGETPQHSADAQQLAALEPLPETAALHAELRTAIARALTELDPRQREAMELAYYEGLSHQQIAARLNSPLGTVKTHIRKGLAKLRHVLRSQRTDD